MNSRKSENKLVKRGVSRINSGDDYNKYSDKINDISFKNNEIKRGKTPFPLIINTDQENPIVEVEKNFLLNKKPENEDPNNNPEA